ncbi:protein-tyrosine phosphatase [Natranaerovirga hydrolytica]|uniref:Protein-tyrosine phosphatase n=1 Tax=Natranaerovirga hydrolytica TaxID=680378 RepID=A0A4R1MAD7_9FIRM|nr:low molecular weight protein arginine phosphatase [Natranaerovirga hydrolytica]TCK87914.1 protein-tyrosine phosphatase [Natranaerovirga hydrolytica]
MSRKVKKIIFVCTGNTCRSPMAEVIGKNILNHPIEIISRGIFVSYSSGANEKAIAITNKNNLSLEQHQAKPFDINEVENNTLILTMTDGHKLMLLKQYSILNNNVYTLNEFVGEKGIIEDPFGQSIKAYELTFNQLNELISKLNNKIEWEDNE